MFKPAPHRTVLALLAVFALWANVSEAQIWLDVRGGAARTGFFTSSSENFQSEAAPGIGAYAAMSLRHSLTEKTYARYGLEWRQFRSGYAFERRDGRRAYESDLDFNVHYLVSRFGAEEVIISNSHFFIHGTFSMLIGYQLSNRTSGEGRSPTGVPLTGPDGEEFTMLVRQPWSIDNRSHSAISSYFFGAEGGLLFGYKIDSRVTVLGEANYGINLTRFMERGTNPGMIANSLNFGFGIAVEFGSGKSGQ